MKKYSIYGTYSLIDKDNHYGFSEPIHCNYINRVDVDELNSGTISFYFGSPDQFKFLNMDNGRGFSATQIKLIIQIVENNETEGGYVLTPPSTLNWKWFDGTNQLENHTPGEPITKESIGSTVFEITLGEYHQGLDYNLNYLNYSNENDNENLSFGEETMFFGNVKTEIEAIIHTTNIPIDLPMHEFNITNNKTWDGETSVYITEIGIYDDHNNLVGIGKLNNPIEKNNTISRNIIFSIDF